MPQPLPALPASHTAAAGPLSNQVHATTLPRKEDRPAPQRAGPTAKEGIGLPRRRTTAGKRPRTASTSHSSGSGHPAAPRLTADKRPLNFPGRALEPAVHRDLWGSAHTADPRCEKGSRIRGTAPPG